jgi:hypothetical protein
MKKTKITDISMLIDEKNLKFDESLDRFLTMEIPFIQKKIEWATDNMNNSNLMEVMGMN